MGAGRAASAVEAMRAADVWMIATPDREIAGCADRLAKLAVLRAGDVVFHCSGSLASNELSSAAAAGAAVASVHPLKTFADAQDAIRTFEGTFCAAEGESAALDVLVPAFEAIGERICRIDPQHKTIYHAASVLVCNYVTALLETGLRCYGKAGLDRETATRMMAPLVRETLENVLELGPARALTGPIARGDDPVVKRHLEALEAWDADIAAIYRELGVVALDLAREQGEGDDDALARLEALLGKRAGGS
jgi:predicted short-subunit dehydrogenase-like oxidoreductase (DUF2520 family)